jgi:hypothetical protein
MDLEFEIGDYVFVISGATYGNIGRIIDRHKGYGVGFKVEFSRFYGYGKVNGWYSSDLLRFATPQEIAHIYAEEICNG